MVLNGEFASGRRLELKIQRARCLSPAGFWGGLWHGSIAPFTFLISLWNDGISIYETNNNGRWYEFGFLLGIGGYASCTEIKR